MKDRGGPSLGGKLVGFMKVVDLVRVVLQIQFSI
jgi:hypothetical protein